MVFTQLVVNSLIIGSIYALVACGFSLIYGTNKFVHFGHGASVVVSAYMLYTFYSVVRLNFALSCIITIILACLLGWAMYAWVYRPLQERDSSNVILLIAGVALLLLLENMMLLIFGADIKSVPYIQVGKGMEILGAVITKLQVVLIIVSLALLVLLYIFMKKTKLGRNMRAVADNKELASVVGINEKRMAIYSFIIGSGLAGIAGILIGLEQNLEPSMGVMLMVKGFTGAVIGGLTSVPAAIGGSYLLGFAENFGIWFLPSGYKDAIAFTLLFLFLLIKPTGLFGVNKGVKQ